jgi:hypothetical protein
MVGGVVYIQLQKMRQGVLIDQCLYYYSSQRIVIQAKGLFVILNDKTDFFVRVFF